MQVIMSRGENNYFDDSDFYFIVFDTHNKKITQLIYDTTRWHTDYKGVKSLGLLELDEIDEHEKPEILKDYEKELNRLAFKVAKDKNPDIGDKVMVSNPKARKHKDAIFTIKELLEWVDQYGRVQSIRATDGISIKTNINNLSIVTPCKKSIESAVHSIVFNHCNIEKLYNP